MLISLCVLAFASYISEKAESMITKGQDKKALELLLKNKKDIDSLYLAGTLLAGDISSLKDFNAGFKLLQQAADSNHAGALFELGNIFYSGEKDVIAKDTTKAFYYYQAAADRGYGPAQFSCGVLAQTGDGIPKNKSLAKKYLYLASINPDLQELRDDAKKYLYQVIMQ